MKSMRKSITLLAGIVVFAQCGWADETFKEDFNTWEKPAAAGQANATGWTAVSDKADYVVKNLGDLTVLDGSGIAPEDDQGQTHLYVIWKNLGFTEKNPHIILSYDCFFEFYEAPLVWIGTSNNECTSGYGFGLNRNGMTGIVTGDVFKFADAEYSRDGGMGSVTMLFENKKPAKFWLADKGKECQAKGWTHVEMHVEKVDDGKATLVTVFLNKGTTPFLQFKDSDSPLDPSTFKQISVSAKMRGGKKVYLDNLEVKSTGKPLEMKSTGDVPVDAKAAK